MVRSVLLARLARRLGLWPAAASIAVLGMPLVPVHASTLGSDQTYLVVYKAGQSSATAPSVVQGAGGTLVYNYSEIGVVVATSNRTDFKSNVLNDTNVEAVAPSTAGATRLRDNQPDASSAGSNEEGGSDSLTKLQWDMRQIHAFQAQEVTGGSRSVVVGDIDTGADFTHPDLAPNIDFAKSVSCIGGSPNRDPAAWKDDNGHGTHTAGTIAAAGEDNGVVGVAPNVRLAIIKSGDSQGFFFPETVVCSFMWAGKHHIDITNNSYFADPFYWNCPGPGHPEETAILQAETRAILFAEGRGVLNIAALGNFSDDLANPTQDRQSPDTLANPPTRPVDKSCVIVPSEVSGVVGVSADGNNMQKSFYSNYGLGFTFVTAPGGDSILQKTAAAPNGRVLSTFPNYPVSIVCLRKVMVGTTEYCYLQGTSMASPHVAGVAALIESTGVKNPTAVKQILAATADPIACPTASVLATYAPFTSVNNDAPQTCTGATAFNAWYGHGQVNALAAVGGDES